MKEEDKKEILKILNEGLKPLSEFSDYLVFDGTDLRILMCIEYSNAGTLELAELVGLAPKNLIARLKKNMSFGYITRKNKPVKPKGRQRVYSVTESGQKMKKLYMDYISGQAKLMESGKDNKERRKKP